jgi:superkiller protein 3
MLHKFAKTFPDSPLTDFIDDYCRWFKLPLPEPEDEPETDQGEEKAKEEKQAKKEKAQRWRRKKKGPNAKERRKARRQAGKEGVLAEDLDQEEKEELVSSMTVGHLACCLDVQLTDKKLLDKLKSSLFAHRVMARIAIQEEDWANAVSFAEKGRQILKEVEKDRGIQLKS